MKIAPTVLAEAMYQQNFWWSYSKQGDEEIITLSPALADCLGREVSCLEDIMGKYQTSLLRLKVAEALKSELIDNPNETMRFVSSFETKSGKRSFQNQLKILKQDSQPIIWVLCVDITEMVALEREMVDAQGRMSVSQVYERQELLEEQNRFISESYEKQSRFLALLSHELRSPLLGITSLVKRLKREVDGSDEVHSMLKTISMTAEQSTYLVNDILTYSQTEYDGVTLHPSETVLPELLENVKQLTKSIASDKGLNVSLVLVCKHQRVVVDGVRLTQILINLIVNGIKFTQFGGVTVEVNEELDGCYHFKITDSGQGIPKDRVADIFKPFAQLDADELPNKATPRYLGAGLGLFVVQQLVELMGGEIKVLSTAGVGTTFEFTLGLEYIDQGEKVQSRLVDTTLSHTDWLADEEKQNEDSQQDIETLSQARYRVLVADDSEINRMVLVGYLADLDCDVVEAKDGRQAWEKFQQHSFDYVLLDIQMPFMDGIAVSQKIDQLYQQNKLPELKGVFAITAGGESSGFDDVHEHIQNSGFDEWLVKPVGKSQIITLLKKDYRKVLSVSSKRPAFQESGSVKVENIAVEPYTQEKAYLPTVVDIPEQFHHLISPFLAEMNENLTKLKALNLSDDTQEVKRLAHYLKGNCMLFQLDGLVKSCKSLELLQEPKHNNELNTQVRRDKTQETLQKIELAVKSLENSLTIVHNNE